MKINKLHVQVIIAMVIGCILGLLFKNLDSATALAIAIQNGFKVLPLTIDYGQKHVWEIESSKKLIRHFKISYHKVFKLDLSSIGGSALTDDIEVPKNRNNEEISV